MRRAWTLSIVLPAITAALVLGVAVVVSNLAVGLLRRLGDEQSMASVRSAGLAAVRGIGQAAEDLDVAARLLGERPTLRRYVEEGQADLQRQFLERFAATGGAGGCAVLAGGEAVVGGDGSLPWPLIAGSAGTGPSLLGGMPGVPPLFASTRDLAGVPGVRVACARWLDDRVARDVSTQVGLVVEILRVEQARAGAGGELAVLRGRAADEGLSGTARVDDLRAFVDVQPIRGASGPIALVIETRLPTVGVDDSVSRLFRTLRIGATLAAVLAALAALGVARYLTRPLSALTRAASRIGAGDLDTPVRRSGALEVGRLAETMDEMRSRLQHLASELRRRHAESAAVLTGIVEGVWAVDRERRVTWMNPQAAERLGIRAEEAIGRFCGDVLRPTLPGGERPCETRCPIVDARFRGNARATEHLARPGGGLRTVVITSALTVSESEGGDRESRQFQVMRDETEVEAVRRLRDAVLANVSHEFRTPLSAQLASLEMLHERIDRAADPEMAELTLSMERGALRLVRLVDNLLESLRIDAGKDSIRRHPLDLALVVQEAIEQVSPLLAQKGQVLAVRLPRPLPGISGDGPRLVQVFTNLLANAHKFAPPGSTITIGGEVTPTEVSLWVADQGPGFPEDPAERRFEPFHRAAEDEPEERGVGLGLYIANSIVERHRGRLRARNTDSGAWIDIVLPRGNGDEDPGGG